MSACTRSHIVVTGTSSGIGRATALYLAAAGLHGLVNNAGIGVFGPLELIPVELSSQRPTRRHGRHGRDRHAAPLPRPGEALVKYVARPRRRVSATRLLTRPGRTRAGPGMPRTSSETAA